MAKGSNTFGGTIKLEGEKEYRNAISNINSNLKVLKSELKLVSSEFNNNKNSAKSLADQDKLLSQQIDMQKNKVNTYKKALTDLYQQQENNKKKVEELAQKYNEEKSKLDEMKKSTTASSEEIEKQSEKVLKLGESWEKAENNLDSFDKKIDNWRVSLNNAEGELNKLESEMRNNATTAMIDFGNNIDTVGKKITDIGGKISIFSTAIAGIGLKTVTTSANFEDSMRQVAATMGITASEIEKGSASYKILEDAAKKCGETTKYSASEAAEALNYLALAGYDAQKSAEVLPKILNLAAAGNLDLATASDMVTDAMSALNMETKDVDKYINEMAKTSQKSNTSVAQLGEATLTCAGTVKLANMSLETMNAELGILANNGLKGAEGGTHLRNIILSLTSPTDTASKSLKELGISVTDSSGNIRDLNDIMGDFNKKLNGMSDSKKTNIISTIFNKTDISAVNALIKGSGEEFANLKAQVSNCDGAAQDMADTMNSSLKGQITLVKSQLESISITIGNKLMPSVKKGVGKISEFANAFSNLSDKQVESIVKAGAFVVALGPITTVTGKVTSAIGTTVKSFASLKTAFEVSKGLASSNSLAINGLAGAIGFMTTPLGAATVAIGAFSAVLVACEAKHWNEMRALNGVTESLESQKQSWSDLQEARNKSIEESSSEITTIEHLRDELETIVDENGKVKEGYENRAKYIVTELNNALGVEVTMNGNVIQSYQDVQKAIDDTISKKKADALLSAYADEYAEALKRQGEATENLISLKQQLNEKTSNLINSSGRERAELELQISAIAHKIGEETEQISQYGYTIKNYEDLQTASISGSKDALDEAVAHMGISWETAKKQASESLTEQIKYQETYVSELKKAIQDAKKSNDEYSEYVLKNQLDTAEKQLSNLKSEISDTANTFNLDTSIQNAMEGLSNRSLTLYNGNIEQLPKNTQTQIGNISNVINRDTAVIASADTLGKNIVSKLDKKSEAETAGRNIVDGATNGINNHNSQSLAFNAISSFGSLLLSRFKKSLNEHSPSKETEQDGIYFVQGFTNGILKSKRSALDEVSNFGTNLTGKFNKSLNFNKLSEIDLSKASMSGGKVNMSKQSNISNNLDLDTLTYAFKTAIKDLSGKVILDDEKMGKFVIEKVEEAIY